MLDLDELKTLHDKAYNQNMVTRERASDDMVFYYVTQWDDNLLGEAQLQYRGEFNILRKAGRQIIADLRSNPIQVNFEPKDASREDAADLIDGLYLSDDRANTTLESYDNASSEAVVCGVGAWELYTDYANNKVGDENQIIRRRPLYEANNNCFWDPNAKRLDKSDANYVSYLTPYTLDGYKELVEELLGEDAAEEEATNMMSSFKNPEESYTFPWMSGENKHVYIVSFYHRKKVKEKILMMMDDFGQPLAMREDDLTEVMDDLIDQGYEIKGEREIECWQITKYTASGSRILKAEEIAGENIPVVPMYGERAFVEGEEHYEGVTRLAKDPQRLRNFQMSYLADIVSRSPRPKPILHPEQIQGFEFMLDETGADNNYPYVLFNRKDANGETLTVGPVAVMPEQPIPTALVASLEMSRQAVEDVANPGIPNDISDIDISGKAVVALQARLDNQSMVYQQNLKHAKRRDAEIYASMAAEIHDTPRSVTITKPDGTSKTEQMMTAVLDEESGEMVVLNDLTNTEWNVYADIGPSYTSKKEEVMEKLEKLAASTAQTDPALNKILTLKIAAMTDGVDMKDVREYANKQLLLMGVREPESEEDMKFLQQQAERAEEPSPEMVFAMAEQGKADAAKAREERLYILDQHKGQIDQGKLQVDVFKAQTERANMQVDAEKVGAEIDYTRMRSMGQQIDNIQKVANPYRASVSA